MVKMITKRDNTEVPFDELKIKKAIQLAFLRRRNSVNHNGIEIAFNNVMNRLDQLENVNVEYVQDIVVHEIREIDEDVADSFEAYREEQAKKRNTRMEKIINSKKNYIKRYKDATNAASGSKYDSNANVEHKNISTMSGELNKFENIQLNRKLMYDKITELYGRELAKEYIRQLEEHEIYTHDETSLKPYCVSVSMYPFLFNGLKGIGGGSCAPKNLGSFSGGFINLVFAIASQFAGAVATVEFLMYMDYFIRKEWEDNYYLNSNKVVSLGTRERTIEQKIEDYFSQVVYSINQPAAARDYQSVFWNISIFDKHYFESLFGGFCFPDGTSPKWESLDWLQRKFLKWFNKEREKSVLTFPVVTMALLTNGESPVDKDYAELAAEELEEGQSFFIYMSNSADSLASCCRLRNELTDNTFSYSLGAGGVATGSINVITLNINRLIQDKRDIRTEVRKVHKYQLAYKSIIQEFYESGLLPVYNAGFISLEKQFLTIGINGVVEAASYLGIEVKPGQEYQRFIESILLPIYEENKNIKEATGNMFNTEFVPAENLGVKNANWDKNDGYVVNSDVYTSYFYSPSDTNLNVIDKFKLHGSEYIQYLDGGSANHINLDDHANKEQYLLMLNIAAKFGTNYWTINVRNTVCNSCGHIDKKTLEKCPKCKSDDVDYATRIIGYLKRVSKFSEPRQSEEAKRNYHKS